MTNEQLSGLLTIIDNQIISLIIERCKADYKKAAELLYTSTLYAKLEDEQTKLWHLSAETLYDLLDEELKTGKITYPEEQ
ncbi:hypothetical protein FACS1894190_10010 [Spirochaetia bacterium]|nr:hypothetical protein FACS1894190_10010 [Spirochaetia bacterium]